MNLVSRFMSIRALIVRDPNLKILWPDRLDRDTKNSRGAEEQSLVCKIQRRIFRARNQLTRMKELKRWALEENCLSTFVTWRFPCQFYIAAMV